MTDESLFSAALAIPGAAERAAFLEGACRGNPDLRREVEELLRAYDGVSPIDRPAREVAVTGAFTPSTQAPRLVPGSVFAGRYKLREQLGEGGMGVVYVADQIEPVQRRVALKIIRASLPTEKLLARFEQERQALALMDHPNIAKVHDAGMAEGTPYFVMELIKGVAITKYCDDSKLTPRQRLELFIPVCRAVQHAHQKGIIHRDLKPSNIIVGLYDGRPVPKVIDFGVAKMSGPKLTEHSIYTEAGSIIGTLEYMSPEQAELNNLDIDTRTDVYALGVILYELLTGTVPFSRKELEKAGFAEMLRVIKEQEPSKPSTKLSGSGSLPSIAACRQTEPSKLAQLVRGELDWITMKALEKDRTRRYETANGLAQDVQRFLDDEPVLAGPAGPSYRLRKFLRRNWRETVGLSFMVTSLTVGITLTMLSMVREKLARQDEAQARKEAEAARDREAGQRARAEKARDRTREALDAMTSEVTGDSLATQTAISQEQKKFLMEVLSFYREFAGEPSDDEGSRHGTAAAANKVGFIEYRLGRKEESARAVRSAIDGYTALVADFPGVAAYRQKLAVSHHNLGIQLGDLLKLDEAEQEYRKALAIQDNLVAEFPAVPAYRHELASNLHSLATLLMDLDRPAEAEAAHRKALAIQEKLISDVPADAGYRQAQAWNHNGLAILLASVGRPAEAEVEYRRALAIQERLTVEFAGVPAYRQDQGMSRVALGILYANLGKAAQAETEYRKALAIQDKLAAEFPTVPAYRQDLAVSHHSLGKLLNGNGKRAEAEERLRLALAIQMKLVDDFPASPGYRQDLIVSHTSLGNLFKDAGKRAEAAAEHGKARMFQEQLATEFPNVSKYRLDLARSHGNLGILLVTSGKQLEAAAEFRSALALFEKLASEFPDVPERRQELAMSHRNMGAVLGELDKRAEAEGEYRKAVGILEKLTVEFPAVPAYRQLLIGALYDAAGVCAVASGKDRDRKRDHADRAMELLQKAVQAGFKDATHMKKDTDLDPLREREDFKKLIAELEKQNPPKEKP